MAPRPEHAILTLTVVFAATCSARQPTRPAVATVPTAPAEGKRVLPASNPVTCPPEPGCDTAPLEPPSFDGVIPTSPVTIGNVVCQSGHEVLRDSEGRLRACTVAPRLVLDGVPIAADAYTRFHENGSLWQTTLAAPARLHTGSGHAIACAVEAVVLLPSGALESCVLESTSSIAGVVCRGGELVSFGPSGALSGAVLARPLAGLGATFPAGTRLTFFTDRSISGGSLRDALEVAGYVISGTFTMHPNGRPAQIELAQSIRLHGQDFPKHSQLVLRPSGTLQCAEYVSAEGHHVHGEPWEERRYMRFDCNGEVLDSTVERLTTELPASPP